MRYAVIGWGSLLWDLDDLAPRVAGGWLTDQGPELALEFVYVSTKRNAALTVVLDDSHGEVCRSSVIASHRTEITAVQTDLADRERTTPANIGALDLSSGYHQARSASVLEQVAAWLENSMFDGAVWTDTAGNFETVTGKPFSVGNGEDYLKSLDGRSLTDAKHYIENAPVSVSTPLRRHLSQQSWWRAITTS